LSEVKHDLENSGIWTPSKLVDALNRSIVSQQKAKKIIAQAIRNKYRMRKVEGGDLRDAMRPSNILVHGRSGSGKTEIFRLIAKLYNAPFIRVEATRYTEVGYHGDDITNIIVDLYKKSKLKSKNLLSFIYQLVKLSKIFYIAHAEYTNMDHS
jgi:ATP-dependent HslUV protease ATP-binding subunit HslU